MLFLLLLPAIRFLKHWFFFLVSTAGASKRKKRMHKLLCYFEIEMITNWCKWGCYFALHSVVLITSDTCLNKGTVVLLCSHPIQFEKRQEIRTSDRHYLCNWTLFVRFACHFIFLMPWNEFGHFFSPSTIKNCTKNNNLNRLRINSIYVIILFFHEQ